MQKMGVKNDEIKKKIIVFKDLTTEVHFGIITK